MNESTAKWSYQGTAHTCRLGSEMKTWTTLALPNLCVCLCVCLLLSFLFPMGTCGQLVIVHFYYIATALLYLVVNYDQPNCLANEIWSQLYFLWLQPANNAQPQLYNVNRSRVGYTLGLDRCLFSGAHTPSYIRSRV